MKSPASSQNRFAAADQRRVAIKDLRRIPGIGPVIAGNLLDLGIRRVSDLKRKNPETLFRQLEKLEGQSVDRCALYTFRCAVYFASHTRHDPELLKWWNWQDKK